MRTAAFAAYWNPGLAPGEHPIKKSLLARTCRGLGESGYPGFLTKGRTHRFSESVNVFLKKKLTRFLEEKRCAHDVTVNRWSLRAIVPAAAWWRRNSLIFFVLRAPLWIESRRFLRLVRNADYMRTLCGSTRPAGSAIARRAVASCPLKPAPRPPSPPARSAPAAPRASLR